jgi:hypothetical protein
VQSDPLLPSIYVTRSGEFGPGFLDDSGRQKISVGGHVFSVGGQLATDRIDWPRREKNLPRRLRCSGLAALRSAFGLPSDWPVVLQSRAGEGG